jgi:hypothetical protein
MPSPKTTEQALYIYVSDGLRKNLKSLKADSGLTYRKLTRRMIEEVSANERLEEAIRSYFLDHNSNWDDSNQTIKVKISQDDETLALASALAFRICGTGSISEVCRLIIRYYVDHALVRGLLSSLNAEPKNIMPAADRLPSMVVPFVDRSIVMGKRADGDQTEEIEYIATSFNLDIETVDLLAELVKTTHVKYLALMSQLIEQYLADDARFKILSESDALLEYLCENVLASKNKSAMIRALIKVEAELQGLRGKKKNKRRPRRPAPGRQLAHSSR